MALLHERDYPGDLPPLLLQQPASTDSHDPKIEGHHHDSKNPHHKQDPKNSEHQHQNTQSGPSEAVSAGVSSSPYSVSGEAFFINDASPVNHFEYFRPWFQGLGYSFPSHALPLWVILLFAHLQHAVYKLVYRFFPFCPFVTPAETYKAGVKHYFSCRKARERFGYMPTRPNDQTEVVKYLINKGYSKKNSGCNPGQFVLILGFIFIAFLLCYSLLSSF